MFQKICAFVTIVTLCLVTQGCGIFTQTLGEYAEVDGVVVKISPTESHRMSTSPEFANDATVLDLITRVERLEALMLPNEPLPAPTRFRPAPMIRADLFEPMSRPVSLERAP